MKKKLLCLMLAVVMSLQGGTMVFATAPKHFDSVQTTAVIQIAENKSPGMDEITDATGSSITISKKASQEFPKFDYLCTLDMENVRNKFNFYYDSWDTLADYSGIDDSKKNQLAARIEDMKVTGEFIVEITYPKSMTIPAEFLRSGEMIGFDENAKLIFGNDVRSIVEGSTDNTLRIVVNVVGEASEGRPGYVVAKQLKANVDRYLSDFTLGCENVGTTQYGTFNVSGKITGFTLVEETANDRPILKVDYITDPEKAIATFTVNNISSGGGGGGIITECKISFDVDGDMQVISPISKQKNTTLKLEELKVPYKDGYAFDGWYTDKELKNKVVNDIVVSKSMTLYGTWVKLERTHKLNDTDHFAYVVGYPEGDVRPENFITREEIVSIFYRLLKDDERKAILAKTNKFSDVASDRWSNIAISTMENGGYISGYPDGTFGPDNFITRAEFATIAARLEATSGTVMHGFTDISGHWAEGFIADAVAKGWIAGYTDGSFRPEQNITRAEAMTIINRMLNRFVNAEGIHKNAILWPDNDEDAWYYYAVEEATNTHEYERQEDGVNEIWTAILPNRDWREFEE